MAEALCLTFTDEAVGLIARKAIERKTGARGLRSIMEGILLETMYELPGLEGVEQVVIGPEAVESKSRPLPPSHPTREPAPCGLSRAVFR